MDNLGVAMNDTSIAAYAVSKGINKSTAEMTSQEKTGLAMQMFMEKTAKYAGNYAKENDTLAGSLGTAKAALSNFMATGENIDDVISSGMQFAKVAGKTAMELAPKLFEGIVSAAKAVIPKLPSAFATLQEGISNALRQAFGDGAAAAFDGFVAVLKTVANAIGSVAEFIKNNFSIITAAVAGVVAGLMAFKTVIAVIKAVSAVTKAYTVAQSILNGTLAVNPIAIVIAAIVALVAAFVYLWQTNEGFRNAIINTWTAIKEFMVPIVESIGNIIKMAMGTILLVVQTVLTAIKTFWAEWGTAIIAVVSMVWSVVQSIFTLVISNILSYLTAAFNTMKAVVETVLGVIQGIIKVVTGLISGDWSQVWEGIKQIFSSVWNGIKSIVDTNINYVKSIISNTWNAIKSITSSVWEGIKSAITTPIEAAKAKVQSVVDGIKNILRSLGDIDLFSAGTAIVDGFLRGLTSGFESVKSTVGGWANWIKEHKGPISYDKRLLIGNGKAIVYGLNKGLKSEFNTVKSTVYDLTDLIATGADKINTELSNFDINIPQMDNMALAYSSSSNSQFNGEYDYNSKIEVYTEVVSNLDGQKVGYGTAKYVDEANQKNAQRRNFVEGK